MKKEQRDSVALMAWEGARGMSFERFEYWYNTMFTANTAEDEYFIAGNVLGNFLGRKIHINKLPVEVTHFLKEYEKYLKSEDKANYFYTANTAEDESYIVDYTSGQPEKISQNQITLRKIEEAVKVLLKESMLSQSNWQGIMMVEDWLQEDK